jgi:N utilization substance protein A
MQSGYDSLVALPGVGISMADALYELGLYSAEEISNATPEDLIQVRGIGEETAKKLIAAAKAAVLEARQAEDITEEKAQEADADKTDGSQDKQTDAEMAEAPPEGASENDQTGPVDSNESENDESDIDAAAETPEDGSEAADTDSGKDAERSENEIGNAETDK